MAGKDLTYKVGVDASDAVSGLKKLDSTVKSTMKNVESELDDGATAGDKFAASIDQLSAQLKTDFDKSATAAQELQRALKEAGSTLDTGEAVAELSRLGFTFDEITADADKFALSLKQLDDVRLDGVKQLDAVAPGLATKLDDVGKSADSSKSVLANMIGNSVQDMSALGGVAGSAGVALGQMGEYMADAAASGDKFGSIIKNFAGVAGPIAALSVGMLGVQKAMQSIADTKAFNKDQAEDFASALEDVHDEASAVLDILREAGGVKGRTGGFFGAFEGTKDITADLHAAGVSADEFIAAVTEGGPKIDVVAAKLQAYKDAATDANRAGEEGAGFEATRSKIEAMDQALEIVNETFKNYDQTKKDTVVTDEFLAGATDKVANSLALSEKNAQRYDANLKSLNGTTDDSADSMDNAAKKAKLLADKVAEFIGQYDIMSGRISDSNAALDLADAFDAATDAAGRTYLLLRDKSPEAEAAIREQARLYNDVKDKVINYHDELGRLPPEVITRINALVDQGDLRRAEEQLTILSRNREANIRIITNGGAGYGPIAPGSGPRSVPATMSGIPTATQLARQIGTVRIPADIYVRTTPRITGIRG